jgi:CHASE2 domain-containing sensor protein
MAEEQKREMDVVQEFGVRRPVLTATIVALALFLLGVVSISASWRFFAVVPIALAVGAFVYWISVRTGRRD